MTDWKRNIQPDKHRATMAIQDLEDVEVLAILFEHKDPVARARAIRKLHDEWDVTLEDAVAALHRAYQHVVDMHALLGPEKFNKIQFLGVPLLSKRRRNAH